MIVSDPSNPGQPVEQPIEPAMTAAETTPETNSETQESSITGISEVTVLEYFKTFNTGDFQATASLFAVDGVLHAPFESAIVGREAIAAYLDTEAKGMKAYPHQGISQPSETGETEVKVTGKVQTSLFGVNVTWCFILSSESELRSVEIKLLAALEELLTLKR